MSKLWAERLTAIGMIVLATYLIFESTGLPGTSGTFPQFTEYTIIVLALIMLARTFLTRDKKLEGDVRFDFSFTGIKPVIVMITAIFYSFAVFRLGFYATSILFFFLVTYMTGYRNHIVMVAVALVLFPLMYLVFDIALDANLPKGILT